MKLVYTARLQLRVSPSQLGQHGIGMLRYRSALQAVLKTSCHPRDVSTWAQTKKKGAATNKLQGKRSKHTGLRTSKKVMKVRHHCAPSQPTQPGCSASAALHCAICRGCTRIVSSLRVDASSSLQLCVLGNAPQPTRPP